MNMHDARILDPCYPGNCTPLFCASLVRYPIRSSSASCASNTVVVRDSPLTTKGLVMTGEESTAEQPKPWSRDSRDFTLAGLALVRELKGGGEEYGPEDVARELMPYVEKFTTDGDQREGLACVVAGLIRLGDALLTWGRVRKWV